MRPSALAVVPDLVLWWFLTWQLRQLVQTGGSGVGAGEYRAAGLGLCQQRASRGHAASAALDLPDPRKRRG